MRGLEGKTALVTGGTGLIGRAICKRFREEGARVIATHHNTSPTKEDMDNAWFWYLDLSDPDNIDWATKTIIKCYESLDILVNCAGLNIPNKFDDISVFDWDTVVDTNLRGTFRLTQKLLPMINDGGSIVNIGSLSGFIGGPISTHYACAKAGLWALTQNVALFAAPREIRCNLVAPGYIESPMTAEGAKSEAVKKTIDDIPLGRLGTAEEVANAVVFLASSESSYITGSVLHVNGGLKT